MDSVPTTALSSVQGTGEVLSMQTEEAKEARNQGQREQERGWDHRFGLGGTFNDHLIEFPCDRQGHQRKGKR